MDNFESYVQKVLDGDITPLEAAIKVITELKRTDEYDEFGGLQDLADELIEAGAYGDDDWFFSVADSIRSYFNGEELLAA